MNWLTDLVRPKIRAIMGESQKNIPNDLWFKCPKCDQMIFHRELSENLKVCQYCSYHMRLSPKERMDQLFDNQAYQYMHEPKVTEDPLIFKDTKKYKDRLKEYREKTNQKDAISVASGRIDGNRCVVAVMNFDFMGGSMGAFVGHSIRKGIELAVEQELPFVAVTASGGARMQEGIISLMQMPITTIAVQKMKDAGLPYVVLLTDPTMGGVSASFAMLGDITIAEPDALVGFAGPRVIEDTIKQKLPPGFQRSEFLQKHGMVDVVSHRKDLRDNIGKALRILTKNYKRSCI